jgi:hemoglobin
LRETRSVVRPSIYEFAGGHDAFLALAAAFHDRCLADPELSHPFSYGTSPHHVEHLAAYWGEVFGGPARYSGSFGGHSSVLALHAGTDAQDDLGRRFAACFRLAADDAGLPDDPELRAALRSYMEWAVAEIESYNSDARAVAPALPTPRWTWDGLASP